VHIDIDYIRICKQMQTQSKLDIVDEKYQQTIIYGIICMITGEMYVGATHRPLDKRIDDHIRQRDCRAWQILERGNYKAYEIQRWPCNTKREVLILEGGWQRAYKASFGDFLVNRQIEGTFRNDSPEAMQAYSKQYREEHKEEIQAYQTQYREEHKDEAQAYNKQYQSQPWTCEWCNKTMTIGSKSHHKRITCKNKPSE
jgi:hypothetical protein